MPMAPPRICGCGYKIGHGSKCPCEERRAREARSRAEANRPSARKRGYDTTWQKEAKAFLASNPTCRRCGKPATVVNHVQPHRGNKALFWNRSNWEPVCKPCHDGPIQSEEKRKAYR